MDFGTWYKQIYYVYMYRSGEKELPRVGHLTGLLQSPHFLCSRIQPASECFPLHSHFSAELQHAEELQMWYIHVIVLEYSYYVLT